MAPKKAPAGSGDERLVLDFVDACNAHDVGRALSLLHPDFLYRDEGGDVELDREGMEDFLRWDAEVGATAHRESLKSDGEVVTGRFRETNEIYRRLGLEATYCRLTFRIEDGAIREQTIEHLDEDALADALEPFLEWAESAAPAEISELQPDGEFLFTAEMGRRWLRLLERWSEETGRTA
jgi:hypothetical protein